MENMILNLLALLLGILSAVGLSFLKAELLRFSGKLSQRSLRRNPQPEAE